MYRPNETAADIGVEPPSRLDVAHRPMPRMTTSFDTGIIASRSFATLNGAPILVALRQERRDTDSGDDVMQIRFREGKSACQVAAAVVAMSSRARRQLLLRKGFKLRGWDSNPQPTD